MCDGAGGDEQGRMHIETRTKEIDSDKGREGGSEASKALLRNVREGRTQQRKGRD